VCQGQDFSPIPLHFQTAILRHFDAAADNEYGKPPYNRAIGIPKEYCWPELKKRRNGAQ